MMAAMGTPPRFLVRVAVAVMALSGCDSPADTRVQAVSAASGGGTAGPPPACQPDDPPVVLVSEPMGGAESFGDLTIDADAVYYATLLPSGCMAQVKRVPKQGGTPTVVAQTHGMPSALAVDAEHVFWFDTDEPGCAAPDSTSYVAFATPKLGGTAVPLFEASQPARPFAVALDDAFIYWTGQSTISVQRAPKGGGPPEVVYAGSDTPGSLVLDDASVLWSGTAGVWSAPKAPGGPGTQLAPAPASSPQLGRFGGVAVDASSVYVAGYTVCAGATCTVQGFVDRIPLGGGSASMVGASPGEWPSEVVLGADQVYWMAQESMAANVTGTIERAPKGGGPTTTIATAQIPTGIAVDEACVYWSDIGGTVWKAPR
jgi:hypothetical protein